MIVIVIVMCDCDCDCDCDVVCFYIYFSGKSRAAHDLCVSMVLSVPVSLRFSFLIKQTFSDK